MADNLSALLCSLHAGREEGGAHGGGKTFELIGDIANLCLKETSVNEIDYCSSLLFNKETGLLSFLKKVLKQTEYDTTKTAILETLHLFMDRAERRVLPYATDVKDVCLSVFTREEKAAVKKVVIPVLIKVLELTAGYQMSAELNMKDMIELFFMELSRKTKHQSSVKRELYKLLGVFAEVYPEGMVNYAERLTDLCVRTLKAEMQKKTGKPDIQVMTGCLEALSCILINFTQSAEEGKHSYDIFKCTRMALNLEETSRYDLTRAALTLLRRHTSQFSQYIFENHERLYNVLVTWSNHHNREVSLLGMEALEAFFKQIAEMLAVRAKDGHPDKATFAFFILQFRETLDKPSAKQSEIALAVKGYGAFAAPCKLHMTAQDVKYMFNEMVQRSEQIFFSKNEAKVDTYNLPSFIESLARIVEQIDEMSDAFLVSMERLVVCMIQNFPGLNKKYKPNAVQSILRLFHALLSKGPALRIFLGRVVYQGLIRTCSHPVAMDTDEPQEEEDVDLQMEMGQKISYKDYLDFWTMLLDGSHISTNHLPEDKEAMTQAIYDELVRSALKVLSKLDLTSVRGSEDTGQVDTAPSPGTVRPTTPLLSTSDPVSGLQAIRPKDFQIFINLVDLSRELFLNKRAVLFRRWIFTFGHQLIVMSTKCPLVSGFYKLLAICMHASRKTGYFKDSSPTSQGGDESSMIIVDETLGSDREAALLLFSKFTKEVLVRIKQYKDDLLASCLSYILALPWELVVMDLPAIVPALKITFSLGLSYLPLAIEGMDALEYWQDTVPEQLKPYYQDILPWLDDYLKLQSDQAGNESFSPSISSMELKGPSQHRKKGLALKLFKPSVAKEEGSQLEILKQRIVKFLGNLGGAINASMVQCTSEDIAKIAVAWDQEKHLKFDMPFMDVKAVVYLDPFLPRVVELATLSSDRQTKVAACELFHSLVLYMLGRSVQQPEGQQGRRPLDGLYRRIFPAMLQLACDVELVARQLFEPLTMQLIHWFTRTKVFENQETVTLLNSVMDGLIDPSNASLRDFSAKCIEEFLKWAMKQTSPAQLSKNPHIPKSIFKRIYSFALHPNPFKRLGAALAFNNIYRVFREDNVLVDIFTFEILETFVESLAMAHHDNKSLGTQEQGIQVLNHLERIIISKAELLCKDSKIRRKPRAWNKATLDICVRWLLRQCGRPQTECRHATMMLVYQLAPCVPEFKSVQGFFQTFLKMDSGGPSYFVERFEAYRLGGTKLNLKMCPKLNDIGEHFTVKNAVLWFDMVLAALECYIWTFDGNLLRPEDIFVAGTKCVSSIFPVLSNFLSYLALKDIKAAADMFAKGSARRIFTPWEVEEYNRSKCTVIVHTLNFLCSVISKAGKHREQVIPSSLWSLDLWTLVCDCVLNPSTLGFNMGDVEVMLRLPEQMEQVLRTFSRYLPSKASDMFKKAVNSKLDSSSYNLLERLPSILTGPSEDHLSQSHLVAGYQQLHKTGYLLPALTNSGQSAESVHNCLLQTVVKAVTDEEQFKQLDSSPTTMELSRKLLELTCDIADKPAQILGAILNKTGANNPANPNFYATFQSTINMYLVKEAKYFIPELVRYAVKESNIVSSVLENLMDQISRDRQLRGKEGQVVVDVLLSCWSQLTQWWKPDSEQETKMSALNLLRKMLLINSKVASDPTHSAFPGVFSMYLSMLTDKKSSLLFKCKVLDLLVFFTKLPEKETQQLKDCLDRLVADHFPLKSSEYSVGSPKYKEYIMALNKIVNALELSGSLMLLELLISIMCREKKHVHEDRMQDSLATFMKRVPPGQQKAVLDVPFKIFSQESSFQNEIRRSALERVCLPLLQLCHLSSLTEFYVDHVRSITDNLSAKLLKTSENEMERQLTSKICCFELMETMYSRFQKEDLNSKNSKINLKYCNGKVETGKEMTTAVTKAAHEAKKEDVRGETRLRELRRQYHCAAYNALMAIITCTQTEMKFYTGLLFKEDLAKGDLLLDNLVDPDRKYIFEIEITSLPQRKKQFISIRSDIGAQGDSGSQESPEPSVHYLASQYLADSSLSEDVAAYDFSGALQGERSDPVPHKVKQRAKSEEAEVQSEAEYVEMEMDELNQHECMATMTALLKHMLRKKITPDAVSNPSDVPPWMKYLRDKMNNATTCVNVKLFIAKLILNTEEVFAPYAMFWLSPLIQLIVRDLPDEGLNYFVVDLMATMLSWSAVAIPQDSVMDRAMASKLLEFAMKNICHETRQIFRRNLELLKTLVQCWKGRFDVPTKIVYDNFCDRDPKSKTNDSGVQMVGVLLANKLPAYSYTSEVDKERFYRTLALNLGNYWKPSAAAAAEVLGMSLQDLSQSDQDFRDEYVNHLNSMLSSLQQSKPDSYVLCVYKMHLHYQPIAERFLNKLLFMLPRLHGDYRSYCLEVISSRVQNMENAFLELKNKGLLDMLTHRDDKIQVVCLKIVNELLRRLQPDEVLYLLPAVAGFSGNSSIPCRGLMYDILMFIYDSYRDENNPTVHQIMTMTKDTLLQGLSDKDLGLRLRVMNFWSHESRLPASTLERMVAMLEAMYSPSVESSYLSYATNFILEMTSKSPDYNREIFEHPLDECPFQDFVVQSSWKQRHAAMTPLFAETQFSQAGRSQSESLDDTFLGVRATQDVPQFTPTQDAGAVKAPYNWLTQSSLDTFAEYSTQSMDTQSSLLFTVSDPSESQAQKRKKYKATGPDFGKKRLKMEGTDLPDSGVTDGSEREEIQKLKRRFLKDQRTRNIYFARRNLRLQTMRQEALKEQKVRREAQVTMYRKYRIGDLPDIQIKYSYVIAPLQALAQRDNSLAKMLFSTVFKAIFAEMDQVKTEKESLELTKQISHSLNALLDSSVQYFPPFIGCVESIVYHNSKVLKLDPSSVDTASLTSMQQPLGIVLLEELLIKHAGTETKPAKRARAKVEPSPEISTWLELARLYKSLGDFDVVHGIFSSKIGTKKITQDALEAEARRDFKTASRLYLEARNCESWPDGEPDNLEQELWQDSYLLCVDQLMSWEELEREAMDCAEGIQAARLDKIWEDTYYQEHYLPHILRSKVKLLLQGNENQQDMLNFVDNSMKVEERKLFLEARYSEELALLYLYQEDYARARYYTSIVFRTFLQEWSSIDTLMTASRIGKLQVLQKLTEMQDFLDFVSNEDNLQDTSAALGLVSKWQTRSPDPLVDPCNIWDDIVTNRCLYIDQLCHKMSALQEGFQAEDMFREHRLQFILAQADSAVEQHNFPVAKKKLRVIESEVKSLVESQVLIQFYHCYAKLHLKISQVSEDPLSTLTPVLGALGLLERKRDHKLLGGSNTLAQRHLVLQGSIHNTMATSLNLLPDMSAISPKDVQRLLEAADCSTHNADIQEIINGLVDRGYQYMKEATDICGKELSSDQSTIETQMALAKYCDKYLKQKEEENTDEGVKKEGNMEEFMESYPLAVVSALLRCIELDHMEARQRFPRLLQLVEYYPETMKSFIDKVSSIPCWMFITWIGQLVALLDKPEAPAVHNILNKMAEDYPQALVYPFKVSKEGYTFDNSVEGKKNQVVVEKLASILTEIPLVDTFINALEQFGQPNALFKDWVGDMSKLLTTKQRDSAAIQQCYCDMYSRLMVTQRTGAGSHDLYDTEPDTLEMGLYRQKFAKNYCKDLDSAFGKDGKKISPMSAEAFKKTADAIYNKMDQATKGVKGFPNLVPSEKLSDYSKWMSSLAAQDMDLSLEIPGQYTGLTKPMPEYHVKIAGFDPRVLILSSIRKPKRITINGTDMKDHKFLVKGGEDLRQDQRIEQLFYIMNQVFLQDPDCKPRQYQLRTYQVVPMTTRVGLIEWMDQTSTLKEFVYGIMTEQEKSLIQRRGAPILQREFLGNYGDPFKMQTYWTMYEKCNKTEATKSCRDKENTLPWDLLRRAYLQMSSSPETFYTLRRHFAVSHALLCVCHYLLGIGDRHLSNFMVDLETGGMIGIDFGHAFGSATQFLPVPELAPVRLTRQILNVMMPLREKGLIESTMVHALRALRTNYDLLLNTMDVFVKDLSVDWLAFADKQLQDVPSSQEAKDDTKWYPKQKVSFAKRKLKGANPWCITRDELELGHRRRKKTVYQAFLAVAQGDRDNVRTRFPETGLTPEQQVACLIDQATDPNILGRFYAGWEPWV